MTDRASYAAKMQEFFSLYDRWTPRGPEAIYLGGDWRDEGGGQGHGNVTDCVEFVTPGDELWNEVTPERPAQSRLSPDVSYYRWLRSVTKAPWAAADQEKRVRMPPNELAVRYARFFWTGGRDGKIVGLPFGESVNNLSIAYDGSDLANLTRRIQAISDTAMFAHFRQGMQHAFDAFNDSTPPHPGAPAVSQSSYVRCNDLTELGKWILDCRPLLEAGDVFYYPDIVTAGTREYSDDYGPPRKHETELSVASLADVVVSNGKVVIEQGGKVNLSMSRIVYPILRIDIPFIDETSMATFSSMAIDNRLSLERARDSLRAKLLELDGVAGEEKLETAIAKLALELRDSIRQIDSEFRVFKRTSAFSVSGASLGTASATLALSATFTEAAGLVGAGGGLIALGKAIETHFETRAKVRERDLYFFWLLDRDRGRRRAPRRWR